MSFDCKMTWLDISTFSWAAADHWGACITLAPAHRNKELIESKLATRRRCYKSAAAVECLHWNKLHAIYFLKTSAVWRHNHVQCRSEKITLAIYRSLMYGVLSWWSSVEMRSFLLKQWHISHVPLLTTLTSFENMKAKSAKIDIGDLS